MFLIRLIGNEFHNLFCINSNRSKVRTTSRMTRCTTLTWNQNKRSISSHGSSRVASTSIRGTTRAGPRNAGRIRWTWSLTTLEAGLCPRRTGTNLTSSRKLEVKGHRCNPFQTKVQITCLERRYRVELVPRELAVTDYCCWKSKKIIRDSSRRPKSSKNRGSQIIIYLSLG